MAKTLLVPCVAVSMLACGGSRPPPSSPSVVQTPSAVPAAAPVARLGVAIDSRGSLVAIQALSTVTFDASGSSGTGLRFGLDFGDGQGADQAVATHAYQTGGKTYKARVIVTDSIGRTDFATVDVVVKNVEGSWSNSIFNAAANRYEFRTLTISAQAARTLNGSYRHPEGNNSAFAGELVGERGATISLVDRTIDFTSGADGGFNSDATSFTARVRGGSASGQTLIFTRSGYSGY